MARIDADAHVIETARTWDYMREDYSNYSTLESYEEAYKTIIDFSTKKPEDWSGKIQYADCDVVFSNLGEFYTYFFVDFEKRMKEKIEEYYKMTKPYGL